MNRGKLIIVTGNNGKTREFERLLNLDLEKCKLDLPEIQSTDVCEVVENKARAAYETFKHPCFADDTGLIIEEWGELPGALIKWFIDNVGNQGILKMLSPFMSRKAYVITAIGYCDQDGVKVFVGRLDGSIAENIRGENGFGYDEIFIPEGYDKTFAEMTDIEKDKVSMRAIAANSFREYLNTIQ